MLAEPGMTILIPAYNEADTLGGILNQLQTLYPAAEILIVNDGSTDGTAQIAQAAGVRVVNHPYNKGNGASVKTGLRNARGDIIVIFDADGQHDARDIARLVSCLNEYELVVGARDENTQTDFGRRIYHHFLNGFATYISGQRVADATSGFRAARRAQLLQFIHLLPNGFSTPVTTTLAFIKAGYSVKFEPTTMLKRAGGESKIRPLNDGIRFVMIVFRMITLFAPMKVFFPVSAGFILTAIVYTIIDLLFFSDRFHLTNTAVLLVTMGIFVFLIGLVSEQIAALRFERTGANEMGEA